MGASTKSASSLTIPLPMIILISVLRYLLDSILEGLNALVKTLLAPFFQNGLVNSNLSTRPLEIIEQEAPVSNLISSKIFLPIFQMAFWQTNFVWAAAGSLSNLDHFWAPPLVPLLTAAIVSFGLRFLWQYSAMELKRPSTVQNGLA